MAHLFHGDLASYNNAVTECVAEGTHLVVCDDDGYCMECGFQDDDDRPVGYDEEG